MTRVSSLCLLAIFGTSLVSGCLVVKTPQIETASSLIQGMFDDTTLGKNKQGASWAARVGSEGRLVEVVEQDGFFVFVSSAGDAIAFDGWDVRSIIGFGGSDARRITVDGGEKQFRSGADLSTTRCEGWKLDLDASPDDSKVWLQQCDDQVRANSIVVDSAGAISEISQVIDANGTRAILQRL